MRTRILLLTAGTGLILGLIFLRPTGPEPGLPMSRVRAKNAEAAHLIQEMAPNCAARGMAAEAWVEVKENGQLEVIGECAGTLP